MKPNLRQYISDLFLGNRLYAALTLCAVVFLFRFFIPWLGVLPFVFTAAVLFLFILDYLFVFNRKKGLFAVRTHAERFSNGDENPVRIDVENFYGFQARLEIIDEIPHQFQKRNVRFNLVIPSGSSRIIHYVLRPVKRGEYEFGSINVYVSTPIGLAVRRFKFAGTSTVPVYPSYMEMRRYQLMAVHNRLGELGIKKVRRLGHSLEFEQIKEYVRGDDYRTVNWKASARKGQVMVNHYIDEKSQQVYCMIDKSRSMKMPFDGLSLLDYAINASVVLLNIALMKQDRAGLVTFSERLGNVLMAEKKATQMQSILEVLYKQKTRYLESDFDRLYTFIRSRVRQRSLLILFTNFESMSGLQRQLPYLRKIAQHHLLLVVFFENTELRDLIENQAHDVESIYVKTIAEKFAFEKKVIAKELQKYGILSILSAPKNITVDAVNKYLEIKSRNLV